MAGFPSHLRDGIVLCCTQDARIYPRKQKLGLVGASNISKEKKKQQKVRSSASSCSDGGEVGERPTGVDLEQEDRGARHQPLGQDAAQDRVGEVALTPYALTSWDREEAGKKSGSNYCFWKSDFKQGVKDGKLKLWRPHCRRKRRQWKREVSINVTKLAKQFGTFKVKSIKKRNKMCVGSLCKRISARMKADQRQCWNIAVMILEHSHTWTRRKNPDKA